MKKSKNTPRTSLSARGRLIIDQVIRDQIATNESIHKRIGLNCHPSTITRITARLCESGWLVDFPLIYPCKYFLPGKQATAAFGLPVSRSHPLGPQSLPTEFALLEYTSTNSAQVQRLLPSELQSQYPWYRPVWKFASHCLRKSERKQVLELIRVDLGGPADHIARKCRDDISAPSAVAEFHDMLSRAEFCLVVITGSTSKAAAIQSALESHQWPEGIVFRLAVFVSLLPLLPRSL